MLFNRDNTFSVWGISVGNPSALNLADADSSNSANWSVILFQIEGVVESLKFKKVIQIGLLFSAFKKLLTAVVFPKPIGEALQ